MSASRSGRKLALATTLTGLVAAPLAVLSHDSTGPRGAGRHPDPRRPTTSTGACWPTGTRPAQAQFAGAVTQLESTNPNTVFAAAGDLIGASTFESFIQHDKPTLDALNEAGLDVSAAGNHEFDAGLQRPGQPGHEALQRDLQPRGWRQLAVHRRQRPQEVRRLLALPDVTSNTPDAGDVSNGGHVDDDHRGRRQGRLRRRRDRGPAVAGEPGRHRRPQGAASIVRETNAGADALKADGADLVILLVHEGAATTNVWPRRPTTPPSAGSSTGVDSDVNAIVSGHTHLAYNRPHRQLGVRSCRPASTARTSTSSCSRRPGTDAVDRGDDQTDRLKANGPVVRERPRGDAGGHRRQGHRRRRGRQVQRPGCGRARQARWPLRPRRASPTAPPRTAAVSPPSATWWPRSSAGRPARPRPGRRRSPS